MVAAQIGAFSGHSGRFSKVRWELCLQFAKCSSPRTPRWYPAPSPWRAPRRWPRPWRCRCWCPPSCRGGPSWREDWRCCSWSRCHPPRSSSAPCTSLPPSQSPPLWFWACIRIRAGKRTFAKIEVLQSLGPSPGWPTTAFTFRTLWRHYAKWELTHSTVSRCEIGRPTQRSTRRGLLFDLWKPIVKPSEALALDWRCPLSRQASRQMCLYNLWRWMVKVQAGFTQHSNTH